MEESWLVCELEDDSKSFTEFTVSAVPDTWVIKDTNGLLSCYWPKKNPTRKIRLHAVPGTGKNWTIYKCRLLMDGGLTIF